MSYSFTLEVAAGDDLATEISKAFTGPSFGIPGNMTAREGQERNGTHLEAECAVAAVGMAAKQIRAALGPNWTAAVVTVSGHCNPGNVETPGWANDYVSVSVTVKTYEAESAAAA